jgi:hypothetical protein
VDPNGGTGSPNLVPNRSTRGRSERTPDQFGRHHKPNDTVAEPLCAAPQLRRGTRRSVWVAIRSVGRDGLVEGFIRALGRTYRCDRAHSILTPKSLRTCARSRSWKVCDGSVDPVPMLREFWLGADLCRCTLGVFSFRRKRAAPRCPRTAGRAPTGSNRSLYRPFTDLGAALGCAGRRTDIQRVPLLSENLTWRRMLTPEVATTPSSEAHRLRRRRG